MLAYIFPGQGAQFVGMGKDLYESFSEAKSIFDQAEKILGWDIKKRCFEGPEDMLKMTIICQPAILTVSIACLEVLKAKVKFTPNYVAGLSLGEYSALVASGILEFRDALRAVRRRAELMEEATRKYPGKMAAIVGLGKDKVKEICFDSGNVSIANLNCPEQVVISGEKEAVDKAKELSLQNGAKRAVDLEVSGAFHSQLMQEAAMEFKGFLDSIIFDRPKIPLISNVDASPKNITTDIRQSLVGQIFKPVLWEDSMRFMLSQGVTNFFEIGPGKVLKGLMRRIDTNAEVINIEKKEDILSLINKTDKT